MSVPHLREPVARRLAWIVSVLALLAAGVASGAPAGAVVPSTDLPTIEIRGEAVPLDGRPLPADLTAAERLELFQAADRALAADALARLPAGDGPDWLPIRGVAELWCTQSNGGYAGCAGHHDLPALDIGLPVGTPVYAAGPGVVTDAGNEGGRGNFVDVLHPNGISSHYLHLSVIEVGPGQVVDRGDRLGLSGNTGSSTAPYLHYEERGPDGAPVLIGPMLGQVGADVVSYPVGPFGLEWKDVPYGTLLANDGYVPPVAGDLDGDGRPERASGTLDDLVVGVVVHPAD